MFPHESGFHPAEFQPFSRHPGRLIRDNVGCIGPDNRDKLAVDATDLYFKDEVRGRPVKVLLRTSDSGPLGSYVLDVRDDTDTTVFTDTGYTDVGDVTEVQVFGSVNLWHFCKKTPAEKMLMI